MEYGLIGEKLGHSFSPDIHNSFCNYKYELCPLKKEELESFLVKKNFKGLNVTIPYKQNVIPYCNFLSDEAKEIGAVNTIVNKDGKLYGYNTDIYGFIFMASLCGVSFQNKKVLILGSGGTSLMAKYAANKLGASNIFIVSRNGSINYSNVYNFSDAEIIINTTPVGMYPNNGGRVIDLNKFPKCSGVLDVVFNPLSTYLIQEAKQLGIPCSGGLPMLVAQAKRAAELFTDNDISDSKTTQVISKMKKKFSNVVLIGMPGSGKTTAGSVVAEKLGFRFVDTDHVVENQKGCKISEIFAAEGETSFRSLEKDAVADAGKQCSCVIATGGGVVLNPENMFALRQNGIVFFLERDLTKLAREGRPLSKDDKHIEELYKIRLPLYKKYADKIIDDDTIEIVQDKIVEGFNEIIGS